MFLLHGLVQVFRTANTFTSLLLQVHQSDGFVQEHANTLNFSLSLSLSLSMCVYAMQSNVSERIRTHPHTAQCGTACRSNFRLSSDLAVLGTAHEAASTTGWSPG